MLYKEDCRCRHVRRRACCQIEVTTDNLHRQLVDFMGLSVNQIALNALRTFIGAEVLWGRLSGGNHQFSLDEFFYCYKPCQIVSSQGTYHFSVREKDLRLVSDMPIPTGVGKVDFFS